jgi:hypothetical protein
VLGDPRHTDRHRDRARRGEVLARYGRQQALGRLPRRGLGGAGQQYRELLPADTEDPVGRAQLLGDRLRQCDQYFITDLVAEAIVDRLEMIGIDGEQSSDPAVAVVLVHGPLDLLHELAPVADLRQRVLDGTGLESFPLSVDVMGEDDR